jgi:hypothetical protein
MDSRRRRLSCFCGERCGLQRKVDGCRVCGLVTLQALVTLLAWLG